MPIVSSAIEHGMAPLLDETVRNDDLDGDHDSLVQLAMHSLESAADTNAAMGALDSLLDVSDSLGIEIAVFKGLAIGARWYPRAELRPAGDVDIVVAPGQRDRVDDLVRVFDHELGDTIAEVVDESRVFDHAVVVDAVAVDVHTDPVKLTLVPRQQDLAWQHTEAIRLPNGRSVRAFDLELSIIHTLINLLRDNVADLLHVYDISLMMDQDPDWDFIADFIAAEGWTDLIRFSLGVACDVLHRPSPLPRDMSTANRSLTKVFWPRQILLKGSDSVVQSLRRQALVSLLVSGRRRELSTPALQRLLPPRRLIDHQSGDSDGSYLSALYRWRREQRAAINRVRPVTTGPGATDGTASIQRPTTTGEPHETL